MDSIQQLSSMTKHSSALLRGSHIQVRPCLTLCFKTLSHFDTSRWQTEAYFCSWLEISLQQLDFMQAICKRRKPSVAHAWTCRLIETLLPEHKIRLWGKDQSCSVWGTRVEDTGVWRETLHCWCCGRGSDITQSLLSSCEVELPNTWTHRWLEGQKTNYFQWLCQGMEKLRQHITATMGEEGPGLGIRGVQHDAMVILSRIVS